MKKDKHKTAVQFRLDKERQTVYAFFPKLPEWSEAQLTAIGVNEETKNNLRALFLSYSHVGQHGSCCIDYFNECQPATPAQYADLKTELETIGYNLEVIPADVVTHFRFRGCGNLVQIFPLTPEAKNWLEENCNFEPYQKLGGAYHVETRYFDAIREGIDNAFNN